MKETKIIKILDDYVKKNILVGFLFLIKFVSSKSSDFLLWYVRL